MQVHIKVLTKPPPLTHPPIAMQHKQELYLQTRKIGTLNIYIGAAKREGKRQYLNTSQNEKQTDELILLRDN